MADKEALVVEGAIVWADLARLKKPRRVAIVADSVTGLYCTISPISGLPATAVHTKSDFTFYVDADIEDMANAINAAIMASAKEMYAKLREAESSE